MGAESNDEDALAIIKEFKKEIEELKEEQVKDRYERAKDRQRIAELELYINSKDWKRNNFDVLAVQLMKKLLSRKKGMDYRDIMNTFNLTSANGAYKLMEKTALKFPADVKIHIIKNNKRRKKVIARVGGRLG